MEEVTGSRRSGALPFNSPLETGVRSVGVLAAAYPSAFDLQRLVGFDYLVVHTGDIGGPASLHPDLPLRTAELLVRRSLVERGLLLMINRGLVERNAGRSGILYRAGEGAEVFLSSLTSEYSTLLRERAAWVAVTFGEMTDASFQSVMRRNFDQWVEQFHVIQTSLGAQT